MKKLLMMIALVLVVMTSKGQNFEGTVKWTMKMDITDPKMKAEMEKINDPANQAKMKQLQDKMNDPAFKAQMDANPQMKAQMEAMMKSMTAGAGGGGNPGSMIGSGFLLKIKDGNTVTIMQGGMMDGMELLHQKDKNQTIRIDRKAKTWSVMGGPPAGASQAAEPKFKITKTSETQKILGYNTTKYVAEGTEGGRPVSMIIWSTTEIKDIDFKALTKQRMNGGRSMMPEGVEGVPLRIESSMKEGNMVMEVSEFKRESLAASDFVVPADFKETKGFGGRP